MRPSATQPEPTPVPSVMPAQRVAPVRGAVEPLAERERVGVVDEPDRGRTRRDAVDDQRGADVDAVERLELADALEQRDAGA